MMKADRNIKLLNINIKMYHFGSLTIPCNCSIYPSSEINRFPTLNSTLTALFPINCSKLPIHKCSSNLFSLFPDKTHPSISSSSRPNLERGVKILKRAKKKKEYEEWKGKMPFAKDNGDPQAEECQND